MLSLNLDKKNDILYISFSDTNNSFGKEISNGFVVLHDLFTGEITGITIFDFLKRYSEGTLNNLPFPISIDFKSDIYPKLNM